MKTIKAVTDNLHNKNQKTLITKRKKKKKEHLINGFLKLPNGKIETGKSK